MTEQQRGFRSHPDPSEWDNYVDFESTELAEEGAAELLDHPVASASTASRRAASSPTSTRRRWTSARSKATRCTRAAADGPAPRASSRRTSWKIPIASCIRCGGPASAAKANGSASRWDQALTDIGGRIRKAIQEGRREELMYHVGPAGRGRLRQPRAAGLGRGRPQQPHQRLLLVGAARAFPLDRRRSAVARLRQRADHPAALVAPRDRATTSTRTRSASWRRSRTAPR